MGGGPFHDVRFFFCVAHRNRAGAMTMAHWFSRLLARTALVVDRRWGWERLPVPLALLTLIGYRDELRQHNLFAYEPQAATPDEFESEFRDRRTLDGSHNDLFCPATGMANTQFGRNVPKHLGRPETATLFEPNPFTVSRELLTRTSVDDFTPVEHLNLLAAAWIQFEIHDWFGHDTSGPRIAVPSPDRDGASIKVTATTPGPISADGYPTFLNTQTHWWDGAQLYGTDEHFQRQIRTGHDGKIRINEDGYIDPKPDPDPKPGATPIFSGDGWWFGLELMTTIFLREHNSICDRLRGLHPDWDDSELFAKARLINTALIAKIHTTEWTPAILKHAGFQFGSEANWYGLLGKRLRAVVGRLGSNDLWSGVAGADTEDFGVPYAITEEFVAVYRMHPLIPDIVTFYDVAGTELERADFVSVGGVNTRETLKRIGPAQVLFSMGLAHPGDITLHNSPWFMGRMTTASGSTKRIDLNALDIVRCRERGVPRYNEFRKLLHLKPIEDFSEISGGNEETEATLRRIYDNDLSKVDTVVGMYGEKRPDGFGFSDTAFRIFAVMAARRLESDRFYTKDFTPRIYTPEGMAWIEDNNMCSVLVRHYPELASALARQGNAFTPWQ